MKPALFVFLFLAAGWKMFAQESNVIPDTTYFRSPYNAGSAPTLSEDSIVAAPISTIPQNFADTLRKYDWLLLQNVDCSGYMNNFLDGQLGWVVTTMRGVMIQE